MKTLCIKQTVLAAALVVGTALAAVAADPITYTWTGASGDNANWSNPANWNQNNGKVPGTADWAIIPASADGQPWQITIDKATAKPADFYAAGPTVFSGGFTLNAQVNGKSGNEGVLSQGKMEVTGAGTAASLNGVTKTGPMKLASDASYWATDGGSIAFTFLCFDNSKDISFVASNQNSKVTLSSMWTNSGGTAQPNLNENNTGLFFGAYDGGLLTLSPVMKFVTGNNPTFIADGGSIVAKSTQATTSNVVFNVSSTNGGSVTFGALTGSPVVTSADNGTVIFGAVTGALTADCTGASRVIFAGGTGNPTINCEGVGSVVTNTGTLTGNATVTAKDGAFVKLNTVIGDAKIDSSNGGNVYYTWKTKGNADVTCAGEGSGVTNTANMTGNIVAKASEKGFVKYGNVAGSFDLTADGEGTAMVFGSVGKAGLDSSLKVSDKAKVTTGATSGSVTLVADKGATAELTSTMATGTHSMTATDAGTLVWVKGAITGDTTIDASNMATVQVVNASAAAQGITGAAEMSASGGSLVKVGNVTKAVDLTANGAGSSVTIGTAGAADSVSSITAKNGGEVTAGAMKGTVAIDVDEVSKATVASVVGATTLQCAGEAASLTLGAIGVAGGNSAVTVTDGATVKAGQLSGNITIDVDKASKAAFTYNGSTAQTGNHTVTCFDEGSVLVVSNAVTGALELKCGDKASVTYMKGVTGQFDIEGAGEGTTIEMNALGKAGLDSTLKLTDKVVFSTTGAVAGNVTLEADKGATATIGGALGSSGGNVSLTAADEGTSVWIKGAVTGDTTIDASNMATVQVVNASGAVQGITGMATMTASNGSLIKTGNVSKNVSLTADASSITVGSAGVAGANSTVKATNEGDVTTGAVAGNVTLEADKGATATIGGALGSSGGNVSLTAADEGTLVWIKGAVTGDTTIDASNMATVQVMNASGAVQGITGVATMTASNGSLIKAGNVSKDVTLTANGTGSSVTIGTAGAADSVSSITAKNGGEVTAGAMKGTVTIDVDEVSKVTTGAIGATTGDSELKSANGGTITTGNVTGNIKVESSGRDTSVTFGSAGVATTGNSSIAVTDGATVKATGSVIGNVKIDVDKGATASLTYSSTTQSAANHTVTCFGEGSNLLVANGVSGNIDLKCGDKASVAYTNSKGITGQFNIEGAGEGTTIEMYALGKSGVNSTAKLTDKVVFSTTGAVAGNVTLEADKGATATIGGALGSTGGNVSLTAADDGTLVLVKGATAGNVAIAVDKGAVATLTSTMATGNHMIACSNEDSVVWIQNTVTGNPVITCEDKGTVKLMKADNASLIGVSGYPTVMCSGEGSSVTMGNLGTTAAGVNVLKAKDGATVTVGTTKFTIQAEASNGALLKMDSMTPSANDNEIVADNATIQFTGAMNGDKSFTSVYEVKGENGLIEGVKANLLFGSDAKTTVKLMPLRSRSSAFIKTTTSGDITFGAGVNYVVDVSDVSQDAFYGDKKYLIAESAGKLTFNAPTSVTVTGAEPDYYSASLAAEGTKLYLTVTCTKVPEGKVAVVGVDEFYETLGEAVENVENGGLIGVMVDVAVAAKITNPADKTVTLNLNGNTLSSELTDCVIDNAGTLVLKGAGTIESATADVLIINRPTGALTIEDGTYTCAKVLENQAQEENRGAVTVATAVFTGATENNGSLSVKGGTFGAIANNGSLTITAGTHGALTNNGVLSISGGTFNGNEYALYNCCTATVSSGTFDGIVACDGEVGMLEITGGAFNSQLEEKSASAEIVIAGLVGVSLNKATFAFDETDYCEDGFVTFKNGDVYIVRRTSDVVITPVNSNAEFGTLTVENAGEQIGELGVTICGTITNVKAGFVPVILIGGQRVNVAEDGSFEGPAVGSAEVIAAYAKVAAWYLDPFCRNTIDTNMQLGNSSPIGSTFDENEGILAINGDPGVDRCGVAHYDAQAFRASVNPNFPRLKRDANVTGLTYSYRQMSVSAAHQTVFGCPWYTTGNQVPISEFDPDSVNYSVPFDLSELQLPEGVADPTDSFLWSAAIGDAVYYRNDSTYDYFKFAVVKDDAGKVTSLKAEKYVGTVPGAPRAKMINDVPYLFSHSGVRFLAMNLNDGSVITNIVTMPAGTSGSTRRVYVTGVADGTPHLVVHDENIIGVWALTEDALHVVSPTPIASFNTAEYFGSASNAGFASSVAYDDELNFVFVRRNLMSYVFERKPAKLIVRGTFSDEENAEEDVLVDFGGAVEKTYSAPKDYMITAVKVNGVADSNFTDASYTYGNAALDTHVYIAMTIEKRPVAQIGSVKYTELDAAFAAAKAGDTVTLLRDVEVSDPLAVGVAMTFDLGGKSLTRAAGASGFMITVNAKVDIVNGVIDGGTVEAVKVEKTGELFLDDIKVTSAARTFFESHGKTTVGVNAAITAVGVDTLWVAEGEFNVYGTIENIGSSYPTLWIDNGELNFYEGSVLTSTAEDIVRSNAGSCQVNVYGGTFSCVNSYPVFYFYRDSTATITIDGGRFESVLFNIIDAVTVTPLDNTCTAKFKDDTGLAARCTEGFAPVKGEDGYYTIQELYDITIAAVENGTVETSVTNGIVAGTEVTITVTPAETYAVDKVYTNDVELAAVEGAYSFLMPAENVEVKATFKATAKPPYEPIPAVDPAAKAAEINEGGIAAKKAVIALPEGLESVPDSYYGLFSAVPGDGVVLMELNEGGTNAVVAAEQAADTAALDAVLGADDDTAALTVVEPLAGFFYSLKQSAAVDSLGFKADGDKNKLGGRDEISFTLDKSEASGFYQMIVTPTPVE